MFCDNTEDVLGVEVWGGSGLSGMGRGCTSGGVAGYGEGPDTGAEGTSAGGKSAEGLNRRCAMRP